jgi:hypothetical protein
MARYKVRTYKGVTYGLKKGETVEQLVQLYQLYGDLSLIDHHTNEVKGSYLVSTPWGLIERNSYKRPHRPTGFIRGTSRVLPRIEGEPEVARPFSSSKSGRTGGQHTTNHVRWHLPLLPAGTKPEDCYACQHGLPALRRRQRDEFFDVWEDEAIRSFPQLPEDVSERFSDPLNNVTFITRWKGLNERVKFRYLRFAAFVDERNRKERELRSAELPSPPNLVLSSDVLI